MIAMILAAGRGKRLKQVTESIPKPLVEVRGQSLIERHLHNFYAAGITEVVINLGWLGDKIVERIGTGSQYGVSVAYSQEGDELLETGGGIYNALHLLGDDPFLVVNADIYTDLPVGDLSLADDALGHLVLVPTPDYRDSGDFDLVDGLVRNGEAPELTYGGISMYRPEFFENCEPGRFSIVPIMRSTADAGRMQGSRYDGVWADIGTQERLAALRNSVEG
jgi:MurNAc alpha-1-phosphate uridylyltransferase